MATDTENTGKVTTYLYDDLGRLTSEAITGTNNNSTLTYTYDDRGNRLTQSRGNATVTYTYDLNNRLTSHTASGVVTIYAYDNNGNTISTYVGGNFAGGYTYDLFNRQKTYTPDGTVFTTTTYRPDGLRHSIGTTKHIWDAGNIVGDITGTTYKQYFRALNLVYSLINNTKQYYRFNGHGDVIALTNASGTVVKTYTYNAFGEEQNIDATDANPFRYCGEYFDKVSGTLYLRARNYNASIGRFTQEDPIRDGGNWYSYCGYNPINLVDPLGLFDWDLFLKGALSVVVGVVAVAAVLATGGAATPLAAVAIAVTGTAGAVSTSLGLADVCESITGKNELKDYLGEPVYEAAETISGMLSSAGTYFIATNPWLFNSYYEVEPGPSGNSLCEDDFDDSNNSSQNRPSVTSDQTKKYAESRPSYAKGQVEEVWNNAKNEDGKVIDPSGAEITWDTSKPRNGQWDMGHMPDAKYSRFHKLYMSGKMSEEDFVSWYRDPKNYRPELPSTNRSHLYE